MSHAGPVTTAASTLHTASPPLSASLLHSSPFPWFGLLSPSAADVISSSHDEDKGHLATAFSAEDLLSAVDTGMPRHCDYFN